MEGFKARVCDAHHQNWFSLCLKLSHTALRSVARYCVVMHAFHALVSYYGVQTV